MIKQLLETQIREQIPTEKCAVLLSGGVDSLSVALAAHNVGKEVIAYSFHLEEFLSNKGKICGNESYDFKTAQKFSEQMGWTFKPTIVPTNNLEEDWMPKNANNTFGGEFTLLEGLAKSKNSITAILMKEVGPKRVVEMAKKMGIKTKLYPVPSLCLGTIELSLEEIVSSYCKCEVHMPKTHTYQYFD